MQQSSKSSKDDRSGRSVYTHQICISGAQKRKSQATSRGALIQTTCLGVVCTRSTVINFVIHFITFYTKISNKRTNIFTKNNLQRGSLYTPTRKGLIPVLYSYKAIKCSGFDPRNPSLFHPFSTVHFSCMTRSCWKFCTSKKARSPVSKNIVEKKCE